MKTNRLKLIFFCNAAKQLPGNQIEAVDILVQIWGMMINSQNITDSDLM